jgi:CheY-like chemotaxis protein
VNTRLRMLLVGESDDEAVLIARTFRRVGYEPESERVHTAQGLTTALSETARWDVVMCDAVNPRLTVDDAIRLIRQRQRESLLVRVGSPPG